MQRELKLLSTSWLAFPVPGLTERKRPCSQPLPVLASSMHCARSKSSETLIQMAGSLDEPMEGNHRV